MAKGAEAKENLIKRFATAVGADYCGEQDKKYYFWSMENGEKVQVAVSLTCPKTPVMINGVSNELNFEDDTPAATSTTVKQMDEEEKATLERLMKELDL